MISEDLNAPDQEIHDSEGDSSSSASSSHSDRESDIDSPSSPDTPVYSDTTFSDSSGIDEFLGPKSTLSCTRLLTFKVVGDNIDKTIRPREMRSDHQTRSLHYFHSNAMRDRIDISDVSNATSDRDLSQKLYFPTLLTTKQLSAISLSWLDGCWASIFPTSAN